MNLCSNAIKFTGTGGSIVVRWRTETRDSSHEFIRVSVADTVGRSSPSRISASSRIDASVLFSQGVGIPPHSQSLPRPSVVASNKADYVISASYLTEMDRLFKSFSQIDNSITRSYGGSGKCYPSDHEIAKRGSVDATCRRLRSLPSLLQVSVSPSRRVSLVSWEDHAPPSPSLEPARPSRSRLSSRSRRSPIRPLLICSPRSLWTPGALSSSPRLECSRIPSRRSE